MYRVRTLICGGFRAAGDHVAHRLHRVTVPVDARLAPLLGPAPVCRP